MVDNRPGGGMNIGAKSVFRAPPDGSTLLMLPGPFLAKALYPTLTYDPEQLVPVSLAAVGYSVLVANPKVPAKNLPELIAYAKANPDRLNYASQGSGGPAHLSAELFKSMAGVRLVHIPYKGNAPALKDLVGGEVDLMFINLSQVLQFIRSDKLRALAVGSDTRTAFLPGVATVSETLPGFSSMVWFGVFAPPQTPDAVTRRISSSVQEALSSPDIASWLSTNTLTGRGDSPADSLNFIRQDTARWSGVIKALGITGE